MKRLSLTVIVFSLIASFAFNIPASAQTTVVVPNSLENTNADFESSFPFDCAILAKSMRYQQVYLFSQFSQPGMIDMISFRLSNAQVVPGFGPTTLPNVQIQLSTTQQQPNGLSNTFADNVGPDVQTVFSGDLTLSAPDCNVALPQSCPFDIMIPLQNPFFYNPRKGNLLLDVRIPTCGVTQGFDTTLNFPTIISFVLSDDVNSSTATVDNPYGLITQFRLEPVPPPPTNIPTMSEWGLILTAGFLGIIGLMVIRKWKLRA